MPPDASSQPVCSRCHQAERLLGQRWCRRCLSAYKRAWKARQRAASAPTWEPVPPAPVLPERPLVLCYLCGYAAWFEWTPGDWRCRLCGIPPAVHHS
jgi:hypothetical protein